MRPTRPGSLAILGLVSMLAVVALLSRDEALTAPPTSAVVTVGVAASALLLVARSLRARLSGRPGTRPVLPITVARLAALGIAAALTGAVVSGAWVGVVADRLAKAGNNANARHDVVVGVLGLLTGLLLVVAGLLLQHAARAPGVPPDRGRSGRLR